MMRFSLIVCTYQRPQPLLMLLESVRRQTLRPDEILVIDGSQDDASEQALKTIDTATLRYYKVPDAERGLTRQRNYGIRRVSENMEIVCFLDDDIVLEPWYFEKLLETYTQFPDALGVGGYIVNEGDCKFVGPDYAPKRNEYYYDGWTRIDGSRFVLRKKLGLDSDCPPGFSPAFSHGRHVGFLPPSGKVYEVEQLMGGVSSFRKDVLQRHKFSEYFDGYGLYEDADFSIRVAKTGKLYCNTAATLFHYHHPSGRPNQYRYGRMVVRNGWYVWRVKNPEPDFSARLKWNSITLLLAFIKLSNTFTGSGKKQAFTEALGRFTGWVSLLFSKPSITDR